jgi:hypothetical protein
MYNSVQSFSGSWAAIAWLYYAVGPARRRAGRHAPARTSLRTHAWVCSSS